MRQASKFILTASILIFLISLFLLPLVPRSISEKLYCPRLPFAAVGGFLTTIGLSEAYINAWPLARFAPHVFAIFLGLVTIILFTVNRQYKYELELEKRSWLTILAPSYGQGNCKNVLLRHSHWLIYSYIGSTFFFALLKRASNGDAQVYNLARSASMLISGSPIIESHSSSRHAFADIFHDIIFSLDVGINSIQGLGLVCWMENIFALSIVSWISYYSAVQTNRNRHSEWSEQESARNNVACTQLAYISIPMLFFQASTVKNDLAAALFSLISLVLLIQLRELKAHRKLKARQTFFWVVFAFTSLLLAFGIKSYSILTAPALLIFFMLPTRSRNQDEADQRYISDTTHPTRFSCSRFLGVGIITWGLYSSFALLTRHRLNVASNWKSDHIHEVSRHLTPLANGNLLNTDTLLNPLKLIAEFGVQFPLPFHISESSLNLLSHVNKYSDQPYPFAFGGYFGEDIAWPGLGFLVLLVITLIAAISSCLNGRIGTHLNPQQLLFASGFIIIAEMSVLVYWQPWYSRFIDIGIIPMVPLMGSYLSKILSTCTARIATSLIIGLLMLPSFLAFSKSSILLIQSELVNRNHYSIISYGLSEGEIKDALALEEGKSYTICINGSDSPSLLPLMRLAELQSRQLNSFSFSSKRNCYSNKGHLFKAGQVFIREENF